MVASPFHIIRLRYLLDLAADRSTETPEQLSLVFLPSVEFESEGWTTKARVADLQHEMMAWVALSLLPRDYYQRFLSYLRKS